MIKNFMNKQKIALFDQDRKKEFLIPFLSSLFLIAWSVSPDVPNYIRSGLSFFPLIIIYLWFMQNSLSHRILYVFLIGLIQDLSTGNIIGIWIASYLLALIPIFYFSQLNRKTDWFERFLGFTITLLICVSIAFLCSVIAYESMDYLAPLLKQAVISLCFYPVLEYIFVSYKKKTGMLRKD